MKTSSPTMYTKTTLCFLLKDTKILLAMKKRGFGVGKWNGTGGKLDENESFEAAAVRETLEEIGVTPLNLNRVATLYFYFTDPESRIGKAEETAVFLASSWEGTPHESDEMSPRWFEIDRIPYDLMWDDDKYWLPRILTGEKIKGEFSFDKDFKLVDYGISTLETTIL